MATTRVTRHINAPRAAVYRALLDAKAIAQWKVPRGMSSEVHALDPREGGCFRVSLTYDAPTRAGQEHRTYRHYNGRFVKLVKNELVVEVCEFETTDPKLSGEMTITTTLTDVDGATDVLFTHDGLPSGVSSTDNEIGTQMALARLAALLEGDSPSKGAAT